MSVRAVWVIQELEGANGEMLYSKRFPTVERRARLGCGQLYHPLPSDRELCSEVMSSCQLSLPEIQTGVSSSTSSWPIFELFKGKLWPVVCLRQYQMMFVAVVMFNANHRPSIASLYGIPAAIALLTGMAEVLGSTPTDKTAAGMELHQYVSLSSPFGSLVDSNPSNTRLQLQYWRAASMPKEKIPAWRPAVYKGSSRLQLHIREEIIGVQYDRDDIDDVWMVYGSLSAKAEMDGHPDVLISLNTPDGHAHLNHLTVHPSVQSADSVPYSADGAAHIRKLRFSGLMDTFTLCSYQATVPSIPIRGFYQMKGDKVVELLVQLKLVENVRNSFDHFEVHLPFYNRGSIDHVENIVPTSASVAIVTNRRKLVWSVPQRLPVKTLEVSLRATVVFLEYPNDSDQEVDQEEAGEEEQLLRKFCVDQNAFCEVHFSISDYTLSGCSIDQQSITTFPPVKHKTVVSRELVASSYRIWNSHGDVLCFPTTSED